MRSGNEKKRKQYYCSVIPISTSISYISFSVRYICREIKRYRDVKDETPNAPNTQKLVTLQDV